MWDLDKKMTLIKKEIFKDIYLLRKYYSSEEASFLYDCLFSKISWKQYNVNVFGKTYPQPRLCSFIADNNVSYTYSKLTLNAEAWTNELYEIREKLKTDFKLEFNSVLANLYRDGNDSNGWHADNERELGKNPTLLSLSFGGEKALHLRSNTAKKKILIQNGDLLLFTGKSQHESQHMIAKSKTYTEARINLTFRNIIV